MDMTSLAAASQPHELPIEIRATRVDRQIYTEETIAALTKLREQAQASAGAEGAQCPGGIRLGFDRHDGPIAALTTPTNMVWDAQGLQTRRLSEINEGWRPLVGHALATCLDDTLLASLGRSWMSNLPKGRSDAIYPDAYCTDRSVTFFVSDFEIDDGEVEETRLIETFRRDLAASVEIILRPGLSAHEEIEEIARLGPLIDKLMTAEVREAQDCGAPTDEQSAAMDAITWTIRRAASGQARQR